MSLRKVAFGFAPTSITGCVLWMDAADSRTVTLSSSAITQWNDKSASANHFVQATTANSPTVGTSANGLPTIYFATTNQQLVSSQNSATSGNASRTVIQVFWCPTLSSAYYSVTGTESSGNPPSAWGHAKNPNADVTYPFMYSSVGDDVYTVVNSTPNPLITYAQFNSTDSSFSSYYATLGATNGTTTVGNFTNKTMTFNTTAGVWYLGRRQQAATGSVTSHLLEMIHFNKALSITERQQVEGYLTQKWGLAAILSAGHPGLTTSIYRTDYIKNSVVVRNVAKPIPYFTQFSPRQISGLGLWLDSADPAGNGVVPSAGTLATWVDKSTAGNNATGGVSPTYSSTTKAVSFNGSSTYLQTSLSAVPSNETFFAVFTSTIPIANANRFNCIIGASGNNGRDINVLTSPAGNSSAYDLRYDSWAVGSISLTGYGGITFNTLTLVTTQFTGGQGAGSTYGSNFGSFQSLSFSSSSTTRIGAGNGGDYFTGTINEIIIYNTVLGLSDRQKIESYLSQKWGTTTSLPGGHSHLTRRAGAITTVANTKFSIVGVPRIIFTATGGTIVTSGFKYHVFTSSSNFVVSMDSKTVNYLVVGGGGGGGDRHGGGGGGGGVLTGTWTASVGTYTVTVGLGGVAGYYETANSSPQGAGIKGGNSSLSGTGVSVTANGGGGGGTYDGNPTGTVGSGGGGGGNGFAGVAGTAGQGNAGGSGLQPGGGGGGGAGGVGTNANTGTGGIGTTSFSTHLLAVGYGTSFAVPTSPNVVISGGVAYIAAGGGGAASGGPGPGGSGGLGGGGRGDWNASFIQTGTANTGSGGGGSRSEDVSTSGRDGGSGLVLLWYTV